MARLVAGLAIASRLFFPWHATPAQAMALRTAPRDNRGATELAESEPGVGVQVWVVPRSTDQTDEIEVSGVAVARPEAGDVRGWLTFAARQWGLDESQFSRIAWCESRWDATARGPAGASGVFQFAPQTWAWASAGAGYAGASPFDLEANVESAAWLMASGGVQHWGCR